MWYLTSGPVCKEFKTWIHSDGTTTYSHYTHSADEDVGQCCLQVLEGHALPNLFGSTGNDYIDACNGVNTENYDMKQISGVTQCYKTTTFTHPTTGVATTVSEPGEVVENWKCCNHGIDNNNEALVSSSCGSYL